MEQKYEYSFSLKPGKLLRHYYESFPLEADLRKLVIVVWFGIFFRKVSKSARISVVMPSVSRASVARKASPFSSCAGLDVPSSQGARSPHLEAASQ